MERIKCFICAAWTRKGFCFEHNFYGSYEWVCPNCNQKLEEKDSTDKESYKLMEAMNAERIKKPD